MSTTLHNIPNLDRQEEYVKQQNLFGDDSLIVGAAFVRGIRDLGYQNTLKAIDELIDNSIQATATQVHVRFGFDAKSDKKPESYAVIDNGCGMIKDMLGFAAKWGGTDREGDRTGLGRYGYGLPSSSVSQGKRFRIYSRIAGGELNCVTVDLDDLKSGEGGRIAAPHAEECELPRDLQAYVDSHFDGLPHGTIVVVDKLDRLSWSGRDALKKHLLEHIGLIYRNYIQDRTFVIDGTEVQPIDPLFLTPGARYFDEDDQRSVPYEPKSIQVKTTSGKTVSIKVRVAYLPPRFGFTDKHSTTNTPGKNRRMTIMGEHEGLIVLRMGRQMDVITRHPWGSDEDPDDADDKSGRLSSWRAQDRYWQIELDFPAELDEKFSVTTSKQSVRLADSVWDALKEANIRGIIRDIKKRYRKDQGEIKAAAGQNQDHKRPSEQAMEMAAEFKGSKPTVEQSAAVERSKANVESEAQRTADQTGLPFADVKAQIEREVQRRPFAVLEEDRDGAPFYRPEGFGDGVRVWINKAHPFFTDLYAGSDSTPEIRAALEVLLFVLASEEVMSMEKRHEFYQRERNRWSEELRTTLSELAKIVPEPAAAGAEA